MRCLVAVVAALAFAHPARCQYVDRGRPLAPSGPFDDFVPQLAEPASPVASEEFAPAAFSFRAKRPGDVEDAPAVDEARPRRRSRAHADLEDDEVDDAEEDGYDDEDVDERPRARSHRRHRTRRAEEEPAEDDRDERPRLKELREPRAATELREPRAATVAVAPAAAAAPELAAPVLLQAASSVSPVEAAFPRLAERRGTPRGATAFIEAETEGLSSLGDKAAVSNLLGTSLGAEMGVGALAGASVGVGATTSAEDEDALDAPLEELKHDIIAKSKQITDELAWIEEVQMVIEKYTVKIQNVKKDVQITRKEVRDLLKKKRQIQNLKLQKQLQNKLEDATADMGTIKTALAHVHQKAGNFEKTKESLSETIARLGKALNALKGAPEAQIDNADAGSGAGNANAEGKGNGNNNEESSS